MIRKHAVRGIGAFITILLGSAGTSGQPDPAALSLDDQPRFERQIAGGQTHGYEVTLQAGDFLRLSIEPQLPEIRVALHSPAGEPIFSRVRSRSNGHARTVSIVAAMAGKHRLQMEARGPMAGRYVVRVVERRPAQPADRDRLEPSLGGGGRKSAAGAALPRDIVKIFSRTCRCRRRYRM